MKCPICGEETAAGGLIVDGTLVRWAPMDTFNRKGIKRLHLPGCQVISGKTNFLIRDTKIPNAHYCEHCKKILGIFDLRTE